MTCAAHLGVIIALVAAAETRPIDRSFRAGQISYPRVRRAQAAKEPLLKELFRKAGLAYPPQSIFIRVFKRERVVEAWVGGNGDLYELVKEYKFCASSGGPGPKRRARDGQIPEGFYYIDRFNPLSNFHLSLGIDYPNQSDRILGAKNMLGGDIFIHGNCVTIGCIPITDDGIDELYLLAVEARSAGQLKIPVHIFPARLEGATWAGLQKEFSNDKGLIGFWARLKEGYDFFSRRRRPPTVSVSRDGSYVVEK